MIHGAQFYFRECRSSRRRLALFTLVLHALALALILACRIPAVRSLIRPAVRPIVRFGYEGPDRYVEHILLTEEVGRQAPLLDVGRVRALPSRRGGSGLSPARHAPRPASPRLSTVPGLGDDEITLLAEARARQASVPLVQSSELVIESMTQPEYPEPLHLRGIEGRVALMALIDTTGRVADITVVSESGYDAFEESAMEAVRQARFRPYRSDGLTREVYALIRYRFRIY